MPNNTSTAPVENLSLYETEILTKEITDHAE
jgi:hypothetical protein